MSNWLPQITTVIGFIIAFAVAVLAIFIDCFQRISRNYRNIPPRFLTALPVIMLAGVCGVVAGGAYLATDPTGAGYIDKLLTLNIANPYSRAFYVGALVLVLIRSKLFQLQGADVGGEFFYNLGRERAIISVVVNWIQWRDAFVAKILPRAFATADYDKTMINYMKAIANEITDGEYRASVESQIRQVEQGKPGTPAPDAADSLWQTYYKTITRMTLEICGRRPFKELV